MKRHVRAIGLLALVAAVALLAACNASPAAPAAKEKVTIATDATWAPFEFLNESDKKIVGFDIDLMDAIAAKANLDVTYTNVAFDPLLAGMAQCQYDAAISSITITAERGKSMLFSNPYFKVGQVVVVAAGNTDIKGKDSLTGKKVGSQISTTGAMEAAKIQGATVKTYDDITLALQDLANGQIDAVITDNALVINYINSNPGKVKMVGDSFTNEDIGIAICKTKADLQAKINAGLAAVLSDGTVDKISAKWLKGS
jgi:polar amino acid transport system substrate-binding protein